MLKQPIIGRITSAESSGAPPSPVGPSRAERDLSDADKALCLPRCPQPPGVGSARYIQSMDPPGRDPDYDLDN